MALAHNMLLRGLNAIYKQAPWVQPQDIPSFVVYCRHWVTAITIHHAGEEKNLFPWIESTVRSKPRARREPSAGDGLESSVAVAANLEGEVGRTRPDERQ